jgi:V-type H+-transporting ATPase subunit H
LKLIDPLIECLSRDDITKAVACFDLGEFCRFYSQGKGILERKDVKTKMANLMKNPNVSAQVKKEAITCYQKLLMGSWSSGAFKV